MDHVESLAYSRLVGGVPRLSVPIGLGEIAGLCWLGGGDISQDLVGALGRVMVFRVAALL